MLGHIEIITGSARGPLVAGTANRPYVRSGSGIRFQRAPGSGLECAAEPTLAVVALLHLKRTAAISAVECHLIERVNGGYGPNCTSSPERPFSSGLCAFKRAVLSACFVPSMDIGGARNERPLRAQSDRCCAPFERKQCATIRTFGESTLRVFLTQGGHRQHENRSGKC